MGNCWTFVIALIRTNHQIKTSEHSVPYSKQSTTDLSIFGQMRGLIRRHPPNSIGLDAVVAHHFGPGVDLAVDEGLGFVDAAA